MVFSGDDVTVWPLTLTVRNNHRKPFSNQTLISSTPHDWSRQAAAFLATGNSIYCEIGGGFLFFPLQWNTSSDQSHPCPAPTTCASYNGLHIGVSVASVPLNLKDLMENQDDAVLGLNDSAIKRNVVRKCLRTRGKETLFCQTCKNVTAVQRSLQYVWAFHKFTRVQT